MAAWGEFVAQSGSLGEVAEDRLKDRVAYLATVRQDGSPRVHPVTPRTHDGTLFVRMYPTSPKVGDLHREPRFALHSQVEDTSGSGGEILIFGTAAEVVDAVWVERALAELPDPDSNRYVVFEFEIEEVRMTLYEDGRPVRRQWRARTWPRPSA